jgi:tRNA-modifying protein YgfZ
MTNDLLNQHSALTRGIGLAELAGRTILVMTGSDRAAFLHAFCTNDVKRLTAGSGCEAFITSPQGKTLGHVLIFCEHDRLILDTSPGQATSLIAHFEKYIITEDVQFTDESGERTDVLVAGPQAAAMLESLAEVKPSSSYLAHVPGSISGRDVAIERVAYTGPDSYFVRASATDTTLIIAALCEAGAARCESAIESARIEVGFPLFGLDITPDNLPQEVARDATAISFVKGCYLGQETVARIDALGHVNSQLVAVKMNCDEVPFHDMSLLASDRDKEVGNVTSAAWSPRLNAYLALAYVRRTHARPGTTLSSAAGPAEVVKLPIS